MGFDSRYWWFHRIEHAPGLDQREKSLARTFARRVCDNTGLSACFNQRTGGLYFYYGETPGNGGPFEVPFKDPHDGYLEHLGDDEVGDYVRLAKLGQMAPEEKAAIREQREQAEKYRTAQQDEKFKDERRPCVNDYAAFLDKRRRGTTKMVSV